MSRKINNAGLALVREFEGVRTKAYLDPVGILTVGVGHVVQPSDHIKLGQIISRERVDELLRKDLSTAEAGVESALTEDVTDNQFAACVSLAFNVGVGAFKKSSIARYINSGDAYLAADRFLLYNKAGGKTLAGLTRRRKAERALFLTEDEPIQNGEVAEVASTAISTEIVKTSTVEETAAGTETKETTLVEKITSNEKLKEVASSGFGKLSLRVAGGSAGIGLLSALGSWWKQNWQGVVFTLLFLGIAYLIYREVHRNKHLQKMEEARIKADKNLNDVQFK
jgi:lysozyme